MSRVARYRNRAEYSPELIGATSDVLLPTASDVTRARNDGHDELSCCANDFDSNEMNRRTGSAAYGAPSRNSLGELQNP